MSTRDHIVLYVNGKKRKIKGDMIFHPLSTYLREELLLTGTKIVCAEGDCGACTVLRAFPARNENPLRHDYFFESVNSCIVPIALLDGSHIITVEGLSQGDNMSPVQTAMIEQHGSQCGFCTPGFVMALTGLFENKETPVTEKQVKNYLTGNLCRCTGYKGILEAALSVDGKMVRTMMAPYYDQAIIDDLSSYQKDNVKVTTESGRIFYAPRSLSDAINFKEEHPEKSVKIFAAATDLGVLMNKGKFFPEICLSLQNVASMHELKEENGHIRIGAKVSLTDVQQFCENKIPEFSQFLNVFASPQIKNAGTLVGNVANASPIGDTLPFLFVMEAIVELTGRKGQRKIRINDFYKGYKQLDLQHDEIISGILIPLPRKESLKLYKVAKRKDLDISTVSMAVLMDLTEKKASPPTIKNFRLAYGGVAATTVRIKAIEDFLIGKEWNAINMQKAIAMVRQNIKPLADVRGSDEYRYLLCENLLHKFSLEMGAKQ